jgi:hypothetical protein
LEFLLNIEFFVGLTCTLLLLEYVWIFINLHEAKTFSSMIVSTTKTY